ncbi:hypothetical protein ACIGGE_10715 [Qipengyuania sp. NPDC077410]|uniref:hypothetical protein n=1 Tax=Qipengyuania sp. NPDC077410 TaxID=3364496 RepID=UPI0037C97A96
MTEAKTKTNTRTEHLFVVPKPAEDDPVVYYEDDHGDGTVEVYEYRLSEFPASYVDWAIAETGSKEAAAAYMSENWDSPSNVPNVLKLAPWHNDLVMVNRAGGKTAKVPRVIVAGELPDTNLFINQDNSVWWMISEDGEEESWPYVTFCFKHCKGDFMLRLLDNCKSYETSYTLEVMLFHDADIAAFEREFDHGN